MPKVNSVFVERRNFGRQFDIHMATGVINGKRGIAKPLEFVLGSEDEIHSLAEPAACLSPEAAQALMDGLWQCGIRPTEGAGTAGSMAAVQEHLKDMRTIAMGALRKRGAIE